ncbi:unnamed protein product [Trichogramma brassicae]|uniref:Uncharacterized protein n=1 Tax=Trichogramma brassicae TaxID=86971 RepID=A0A6H5I3G2_9HYME|nr:unnamed protein product [Trichogramma brassicae]
MILRRDQYEGPRAQRVILYIVPPKAIAANYSISYSLQSVFIYITYSSKKSKSTPAKRRAIGSTGGRAIYRTTTRTTTSQTFSRAYLYTGVSSERKQNRSSYTSGVTFKSATWRASSTRGTQRIGSSWPKERGYIYADDEKALDDDERKPTHIMLMAGFRIYPYTPAKQKLLGQMREREREIAARLGWWVIRVHLHAVCAWVSAAMKNDNEQLIVHFIYTSAAVRTRKSSNEFVYTRARTSLPVVEIQDRGVLTRGARHNLAIALLMIFGVVRRDDTTRRLCEYTTRVKMKTFCDNIGETNDIIINESFQFSHPNMYIKIYTQCVNDAPNQCGFLNKYVGNRIQFNINVIHLSGRNARVTVVRHTLTSRAVQSFYRCSRTDIYIGIYRYMCTTRQQTIYDNSNNSNQYDIRMTHCYSDVIQNAPDIFKIFITTKSVKKFTDHEYHCTRVWCIIKHYTDVKFSLQEANRVCESRLQRRSASIYKVARKTASGSRACEQPNNHRNESIIRRILGYGFCYAVHRPHAHEI